MVVNNPVALPLLLTAASLVLAGYKWESTPESLPLWWTPHAHPILWVPRWLGLLLFPFLELAIPYIIYQVACRDSNLNGQSGESAYAVANIIALPGLLVFVEYALVYIPAATSDTHDFLPHLFTANLAIWALFWLGYNLQYVEPNSSVGVPVFFPITEKDLWARTHRRAGWVLMVFGVVLFVFGLACPIGVAYLVVALVIWIGAYVVVVLDSYVLSRTTSRPQQLQAHDRALGSDEERALLAADHEQEQPSSSSSTLDQPLINSAMRSSVTRPLHDR